MIQETKTQVMLTATATQWLVGRDLNFVYAHLGIARGPHHGPAAWVYEQAAKFEAISCIASNLKEETEEARESRDRSLDYLHKAEAAGTELIWWPAGD